MFSYDFFFFSILFESNLFFIKYILIMVSPASSFPSSFLPTKLHVFFLSFFRK